VGLVVLLQRFGEDRRLWRGHFERWENEVDYNNRDQRKSMDVVYFIHDLYARGRPIKPGRIIKVCCLTAFTFNIIRCGGVEVSRSWGVGVLGCGDVVVLGF